MSRRHHGRNHAGGRYRHDPPRPAPGVAPATPPAPDDASLAGPRAPLDANPAPFEAPEIPANGLVPNRIAPLPAPTGTPIRPPAAANGHVNGGPAEANGQERTNGCTAPQLRRFIKSRPYVPMHELRRRFAIDGDDDDVTQVSIDHGHVYVGLPPREGSLLGELLRGGEIGYELSLDPRTPVVVGVYPMRPIPRS